MKKLLLTAVAAFGFCGMVSAQTPFSTIKLTYVADQLRFEVPGQHRYWIMSKTGLDNKAFALYSPEDGGWFTYWKEGSGDMILNKGKMGIGTATPDMKLSVYSAETDVSRFHYSGADAISGIRIGRTSSFGDFVNLPTGFGIGVGQDANDLPLNSQLNSDIDFFIDKANSNVGIGTVSPDMKLSVYTAEKYVSRFHYSGADAMSGIRIGRTGSFGDFINLPTGFGIGVGQDANNLPLNTQLNSQVDFFIDKINSNVGIGTTNPDEKLTVNGTVHSKEVKVDLSVPGPDYVFEPDYNLISLEETKAFITANKHLPEVPTAKEMETNGVELGDMSMILLKKIEEMTLHQIKLMEEIKTLKEKMEALEK